MIQRLLIANRGEIARRIAAACRETGIESVAVYSEADARSPHRFAADRSVLIGPAIAAESYLSISRLIDAARSSGADAVHPGYGFLSENPGFAAACEDAGLTFVGPPAAVIERMGSKIEARRVAEAAGVPVVPGGTPVDQSDAGIRQEALRIRLPVLIKASAGGGGKGMRTVRTEAELDAAIPAARREAVAAFGDGTLYVERLVDRPRHVEVQVFGDGRGEVVHLFERECSVQRRHQKIIEESPSPVLTPAIRDRMTAAALAAARAVGYRSAGTIEFLLEGTGDAARFYFLEMNTRLQVEHPVTEAVTGVDLVRAQLTVASGRPLPWRQADLTQRGHAIECRVYAEDPAHGFLPQAGPLLLYREPVRPGIRIDSGVAEGGEVSVYYDPMLAKLIAAGETRDAARTRATAALRAYAILGIRTNIPFLLRILEDPHFAAADIDTAFLDRGDARLTGDSAAMVPVPAAALAAAAACDERPAAVRRAGAPDVVNDPWTLLTGWRS
ncbi:MAG TPA: biotin carboxylase N-terminal domain-containing protein [Vicinamibacterales bacterium]|nr:biotin carboxylase N-terminal domain-containing protein [Vicinamibacterales bacterium]